MEQYNQENKSIIINKNIYLVFTFLFLLFSISFISAVPTVDRPNFAEGLIVDFEDIDVHKINDTILVTAHAYNISNGHRVINDTTQCRYDLYTTNGTQLITETTMNYKVSGEEWQLVVDGANFSTFGEYSYSIYCNSTNFGGYVSAGFLVTPTGEILTVADTFSAFSLILSLLVLVIICLVVGNTFQTQYWLYRSFFYFCGILLSIVAINSAKVMARESLQLGVMANMGLLISIVIFGLFMLFIFVNAFKEIIKVLKDKKEMRWSY